jgi:hypothetical protein
MRVFKMGTLHHHLLKRVCNTLKMTHLGITRTKKRGYFTPFPPAGLMRLLHIFKRCGLHRPKEPECRTDNSNTLLCLCFTCGINLGNLSHTTFRRTALAMRTNAVRQHYAPQAQEPFFSSPQAVSTNCSVPTVDVLTGKLEVLEASPLYHGPITTRS